MIVSSTLLPKYVPIWPRKLLLTDFQWQICFHRKCFCAKNHIVLILIMVCRLFRKYHRCNHFTLKYHRLKPFIYVPVKLVNVVWIFKNTDKAQQGDLIDWNPPHQSLRNVTTGKWQARVHVKQKLTYKLHKHAIQRHTLLVQHNSFPPLPPQSSPRQSTVFWFCTCSETLIIPNNNKIQ